jgi:serine/threonine-protein kinase
MWSQEIVSAIRGCKVMLLSISPHSTESENVVKELALASERKKPIIPVYLEQAEIPETMEYQLAGIQRVEYFVENEDAAFNAMVRSLVKLGVNIDTEKTGINDEYFESALATHHNKRNPKQKLTPAKIGLLLGIAALAISLVGYVLISPSQGPPGERGRPKGGMGRFDRTNGEDLPSRVSGATPGPSANSPGRKSEKQSILQSIQEQRIDSNNQTLRSTKLAILPFKVLGASDNEFIAEGMTMELISKLQPISGLTVIASNSTMKFKDSTLSPSEIGQQLNAGSLLRGTIQQGNEQLKVIVNLVDANTQEVKWSQSFDGNTRDMLKLQGEIAQSVASKLKLVLSPDEIAKVTKLTTEIPEAYQEYLQGRIEWKKRSKQSFAAAIKHFEKAIQLDPKLALAYAGLADIYVVYPYWQIESPTTALPKARMNAEKAIELDPNIAEPWNNLAFVESHYFNWKKSQENFNRAININRNYSTAWHWQGAVFERMGLLEKRRECAENAYELDPKYAEISNGMAHMHLFDKNYQDALMFLENAYILSNRENKSYKALSVSAYLEMNEPEKGKEVLNNTFGSDLNENTMAIVAMARCEARLGNYGKSYEHLSTLLHLTHKNDRYISEDNIAIIYAELEDKDKTFYWLNEGISNFSPQATMFIIEPVFQKWSEEKEFKNLKAKVGL